MFQYLKERQYYVDLYDLHTIEECLDWYWRLRKGMEQHRNELQKSDPDHDFATEVHKGCSYVVNALKGERYRHKNERIDEWMAKDKKLQDLQDNTLPPENIRCEDCHSKTKLIETTLHESFADNTARVSFMFECLKCQKRAVYYEDGSKWEYEREKCKDCHVELESKAESDKKNDTLTMTTFCPSCTYKVVHVTDFKRNDEERKKKDARDKALLQEYRTEFCLDDSNGPEYVRSMDGIKDLVDSWKEQEKKEKNPIYQKAKNLKKTKLNQLKELIAKATEKEGFADLEFGKPEMGSYVVVDFTINDSKDDREEYDSRKQLKKLIENSLLETNWRLMSDGIRYRLGILTGRLKAYEREEDLVSIVEK